MSSISKRILNTLGGELTSPDENYIMSIDLGVCVIKLSTDAEEMHLCFPVTSIFRSLKKKYICVPIQI